MNTTCPRCPSVTSSKSLENVTTRIVSTYTLKQRHSKSETVLGMIEASVNMVSVCIDSILSVWCVHMEYVFVCVICDFICL